jgi:hypothetical protein
VSPAVGGVTRSAAVKDHDKPGLDFLMARWRGSRGHASSLSHGGRAVALQPGRRLASSHSELFQLTGTAPTGRN